MEKKTMRTVKDIAKELNVTAKTVRNWIGSGELRAYNVGTKIKAEYRIDPDDYQAFLNKRRLG